MSIELHTVDNGTVNAIDDARLYAALTSNKAGKVEGAQVTYSSGLVLHIADGWGVVQGRVFSIEAEDITVEPATSGTMKGKLYAHIDLSDTEHPIKILSVARSTLPASATDLLNKGGTLYDLTLATYDVGETAVTNLVNNGVISLAPDMSGYMSKSAFSFNASTSTLTINLD